MNKPLSKHLQPLITTTHDVLHFTSILQDEEYVDDDMYPIQCYYCDSTSIKRHHRVLFEEQPLEIQTQIMEICPAFDEHLLTYWICEDCNSVLAVKSYTRKSQQEKKIQYIKYDSFVQAIAYLKENEYLTEESKPIVCFNCDSEDLQYKQVEHCLQASCKACKKVLGYKHNGFWRICLEDNEFLTD